MHSHIFTYDTLHKNVAEYFPNILFEHCFLCFNESYQSHKNLSPCLKPNSNITIYILQTKKQNISNMVNCFLRKALNKCIKKSKTHMPGNSVYLCLNIICSSPLLSSIFYLISIFMTHLSLLAYSSYVIILFQHFNPVCFLFFFLF